MLKSLTILLGDFANEPVGAYCSLKGVWCACTHQKKLNEQPWKSSLH